MGHKPALMLVPDVSQDGAPQIEHPVTLLASELGSPVGSLNHGYGIHLSGPVESFQPLAGVTSRGCLIFCCGLSCGIGYLLLVW